MFVVKEDQFDWVDGPDGAFLHGYTQNHEFIGFGEAMSEQERQAISALPLQWTLYPSGRQIVRKYAELDGRAAIEGAATVVRIPSNAIIVLGEIAEPRWTGVLRAFETFAKASAPKSFSINVPFRPLSRLGERTREVNEFLAGEYANQSTEEVSLVLRFGTQLQQVAK